MVDRRFSVPWYTGVALKGYLCSVLRRTPVACAGEATISPGKDGADSGRTNQSNPGSTTTPVPAIPEEAPIDPATRAEGAILVAKGAVMNGKPLWDDSQPWQLSTEAPVMVLLEERSYQLNLYEIDYQGPDQAHPVERVQLDLDPD